MRTIKLNPIDEVLKKLHENFKTYELTTERISVLEAVGRTISHEVVSEEMIPPYRKSTVDGYAMKASDETSQRVLIDQIVIEQPRALLVDEQCIYVTTGGRVPEDAQVVVKIEETQQEGETIISGPSKMTNIIEAGDDMMPGDCVVKQGKILDVFDIGAMVSLGIESIDVYCQPKLTLLSSGDELIQLGQKKHFGQTRDINTHTLSIMAKTWGFRVIESALIKDTREDMLTALHLALKDSDLVLVSGGSSMGNKDFTFDVLKEMGEILTDGMALKPGKPTIIARVNGKLVVGIPGHPVSAIMVFRILMSVLSQIYKLPALKAWEQEGILTKDIYPAKGRDTYQMVRLVQKDGQLYVEPTSGKSGMITLLTKSDAFTIVPKEVEKIEAGSLVGCFLL